MSGTEYTEVRLHILEQSSEILSGENARGVFGRIMDGSAPEFFGHLPAGSNLPQEYRRVSRTHVAGHPDPSMPHPFSFRGGKGKASIIAFGRTAQDKLSTRLISMPGKAKTILGPVRMEINSGDISVTPHKPTMYYISNLAIARRPETINALRPKIGSPIEVEGSMDSIKRCILEGLMTQATYLDLDNAQTYIEGSGQRPPDRLMTYIDEYSMDCDILSVGHMSIVLVNKGENHKAVAVAHQVVFALDVEIKGPWMAGYMRNSGFGLIGRYLPHLHNRQEAA
jgi:hypothetical protein